RQRDALPAARSMAGAEAVGRPSDLRPPPNQPASATTAAPASGAPTLVHRDMPRAVATSHNEMHATPSPPYATLICSTRSGLPAIAPLLRADRVDQATAASPGASTTTAPARMLVVRMRMRRG